MSIENIKEIGRWKDTFQASADDSDGMVWKIDGYQYRLGLGLKENKPGWYHLTQTISLKFIEVNGEIKISEFSSSNYVKTPVHELEIITPLPATQKIIHKLAAKSFEVPQSSESMLKLYDMHARVCYPDGEQLGLSEFAPIMRQSNTDNVVEMGEWSNTYIPVEGDSRKVEWIAEGLQHRLGFGIKETGEAWYKMRQLSQFSFTDYSGKEGIGEQNILEYSKSKQ